MAVSCQNRCMRGEREKHRRSSCSSALIFTKCAVGTKHLFSASLRVFRAFRDSDNTTRLGNRAYR